MDSIGEKIRELRTSKGLSVSGLARELDVSRQSVINWEKGKSVPSPELLYSLCNFFNIGIEQLIGAAAPVAELPTVDDTDASVSCDRGVERYANGLDELKVQIEQINLRTAQQARIRNIIVASVLTMICAAIVISAAYALALLIPYLVNVAKFGKGFVSLVSFGLSSSTDILLLLGIIAAIVASGMIAGLIYAKKHPKVSDGENKDNS